MFEDTPTVAALFDPTELQAAAAACCGRFGDPDLEARRLVALREMVACASALARELDTFSRAASTHLRGVHCTASLQPEAARLTRMMTSWLDHVQNASNAYRDWQDLRALAESRAQRPDPPAQFASQLLGALGAPVGPLSLESGA